MFIGTGPVDGHLGHASCNHHRPNLECLKLLRRYFFMYALPHHFVCHYHEWRHLREGYWYSETCILLSNTCVIGCVAGTAY